MYQVQFALHCNRLLNHTFSRDDTNDVFFGNVIHCHTIYIFLSPKKKLFWCQNLVCDCISQTCICSFSFYSPINPITWALPMWSCKDKKWCSASLRLKSCSWYIRLIKDLKFLYCEVAPSITKILNPVDCGVSCANCWYC